MLFPVSGPFPFSANLRDLFRLNDNWYRQQIKNNLKFLSESTRNLPEITTILYRTTTDYLSIAERQKIFKQDDGYEQNYYFYNLMLSKRDKDIRKILQILIETDNSELVQVIQKRGGTNTKPKYQNDQTSNLQINQNDQNDQNQGITSINSKNDTGTDGSNDQLFYLGSGSTSKSKNINLLRLDVTLALRLSSSLHLLREFILQGVELNAPDLLYILGKSPLSKIHLFMVLVHGDFETRVNLPHLRDFVYHEIKDHNCYHYQLRKHLSREKLRSILFFAEFPAKNLEFDLSDLWNLKVDLLVAFDEWKALQIKHEEGDILINLDYFQIGDLENVEIVSSIRVLSLRECILNHPLIPMNLTYLNLHDVTIDPSDLARILSFSTRLVDFYFWPKFQLKGRISPQFDLQLEILPKSIKNLGLRMTNLILKSGLTLREIDLDSLILDKCDYSSNFECNFHRIFKCKSVVVIGFHFKCPNEKLLQSLLKIEGICSICLESYAYSRVENSSSSKFTTWMMRNFDKNLIEKEIRNFLTNLGISDEEGSFNLWYKNGDWRGRLLFDEIEINQIWDKSFNFSKFCV